MGECTLCFQNEQQFLSSNYCHFAAFNDHIDCLRYAHQEGCDLDLVVGIISIRKGSLQCLEYAHKNGGEMFVHACEMAARYGQLECMKYIFDNGGSIGNSCYWAVKHGHINCLKFAHENGGTFKKIRSDNSKKIPHKIALKKNNNHHNCYQYACNHYTCDNFSGNTTVFPPDPPFISSNDEFCMDLEYFT